MCGYVWPYLAIPRLVARTICSWGASLCRQMGSKGDRSECGKGPSPNWQCPSHIPSICRLNHHFQCRTPFLLSGFRWCDTPMKPPHVTSLPIKQLLYARPSWYSWVKFDRKNWTSAAVSYGSSPMAGHFEDNDPVLGGCRCVSNHPVF